MQRRPKRLTSPLNDAPDMSRCSATPIDQGDLIRLPVLD
jgi:hypothetical protein